MGPPLPPEQTLARIESLVAQVRDGHVRSLLQALLADPRIRPGFLRAPAAKRVHHAYPGGLCEHTLSVLELGWRVCDQYPQLDRDLVTAGCLLHDLGKAVELVETPAGLDYSEEGNLVGHLIVACQWIHEKAAALEGFPRELEWHLTHLVAAHHGRHEYGSPKEPATLEAMVVHALDELDTRVSAFALICAAASEPGEPGPWTDRKNLYGRRLFRGPSWDGRALPDDARRFEGEGQYRGHRGEG